MKHIFVNLKRFDIPYELDGVNRISSIDNWAIEIITKVQTKILGYENCEFVFFFPEAHILIAKAALTDDSPIILGCQGLMYEDTKKSGNFGAFTSSLPAAAAKALGCNYALIGHCEERRSKKDILCEAGVSDEKAETIINQMLNKEIRAAISRGMKVLYCVGEKDYELDKWQEVLSRQVSLGLESIDSSQVIIAYEPIWSIGPGKVAADKAYISKVGHFLKQIARNISIVYGGGLKEENAKMLASIEVIDGGLIALTRFSGEIGFYPNEYLNIVDLYLGN